MKRWGAILILSVTLILVAAVRASSQQESPSADDGRFLLFQEYFETSVDGKPIEQKAVFKIDTHSGRAWMFLSYLKNGQLVQKWVPIDN